MRNCTRDAQRARAAFRPLGERQLKLLRAKVQPYAEPSCTGVSPRAGFEAFELEMDGIHCTAALVKSMQ